MESRMRSDLLDGPKEIKVMTPMTHEMKAWLDEEAKRDHRNVAQLMRLMIAEQIGQLEYMRQEDKKQANN